MAMGGQTRVSVLLQEGLLSGKVADSVLDNLLQNLTHHGVCTPHADRVVQFGHREEEPLVLMIEFSNVNAEALVPPKALAHGGRIAIEHDSL
jgi:hypothetical protein